MYLNPNLSLLAAEEREEKGKEAQEAQGQKRQERQEAKGVDGYAFRARMCSMHFS